MLLEKLGVIAHDTCFAVGYVRLCTSYSFLSQAIACHIPKAKHAVMDDSHALHSAEPLERYMHLSVNISYLRNKCHYYNNMIQNYVQMAQSIGIVKQCVFAIIQ